MAGVFLSHALAAQDNRTWRAPSPQGNDWNAQARDEAEVVRGRGGNATAIPLDPIGAAAGKHYSGDGLGVTPAGAGARLRCVFQRMTGRVTTEGLWLSSTADGATGQPFRVKAVAVGRAAAESPATLRHATFSSQLETRGRVEVVDQLARFVRRGLTEEYSVSIDGVRQDFVIDQRPEGEGALRVDLVADGAEVEQLAEGVQLVLNDGWRKIVYNRLRVVDANRKELPARISVAATRQRAADWERNDDGVPVRHSGRLAVLVDDSDAVYPIRIDPTFSDANWVSMGGMPGADGEVYAAVVDGSGNLYIGGVFTTAGGLTVNRIAKWNGSAWSALGSGMNASVKALAVSGSDVYAGGGFTLAGGVAANRVAKWNGSAWSALGTGLNGTVEVLAVSGSKVYAGGDFSTAGGVGATNIAEWNGSSWSALGSGINAAVQALAVSGSDVYAGGGFSMAGGVGATNIAKWNGSAWSALGVGVYGTVYTLAAAGGTVYAGGYFRNAGGTLANYLAKWNGSAWSELGTGMDFTVLSLAVSGSDLYAGGAFTTAGGRTVNHIAKWNGSAWSALGTGVSANVRALAVWGSNVYAGGGFTLAGGVEADRIAKWNGSSWSALGTGLNGSVQALAVSGSEVYAGGWFTTAGESMANRVAKWNGSSWSVLGSGMNGRVYALAVSGSDLYAGGTFTVAGGIKAYYVAKWNGSAWSNLGLGVDNDVHALAVSGSDLYVAGKFLTAGGVFAKRIAKWRSGVGWTTLGSGMNNEVYALAVSGSDLYAGGYFGSAGGIEAHCIARWNGSSWSALGPGIGFTVYALAVSGSDLYAGGKFTTAGGSDANNIAKWNGSVWNALGAGLDGEVRALAVSGSDVYAGGCFTNAGGTVANYLARWNGSTWSALGSGLNNYVQTLAMSGSNLYVGGWFTAAGGKVSAFVAKAMTTGSVLPLEISTPASLPAGIVGSAYSRTLTASGGVKPYVWSLVSGNLAPGLSLNSNGVIGGTPTVAANVSFVVRVTDADQQTATRTFSLSIGPASPTITTPSPLVSGYVGLGYSLQLGVTGSLPAYVWSIDGGGLPAGLTLSASGVISGTPGMATNASFSVRVTGGNGLSATRSYTLTILKGTDFITTSLPGQAYLNDPVLPLTASARSGLPVRLELDSGPARLTGGFLLLDGAGTVTVRASTEGNPLWFPAVSNFVVTVTKAPQSISFAALPEQSLGTLPIRLQATANSGLPVAFSVSGPATLTGDLLTLTNAGEVVVTASQSGNAVYAPAAAVVRRFPVTKRTQSITFAAITNQLVGNAVSLHGIASSGLPVVYTVTGPASLAGNLLLLTSTGTVSVTASQGGNEVFAPATNVTRTFSIAKRSQTISFEVIPDCVWGEAPFALRATASSALPVTFTLISNTPALAGNLLSPNSEGLTVVRAGQSGNGTYAAAAPVDRTFRIYGTNWYPVPNRSTCDFRDAAYGNGTFVAVGAGEGWTSSDGLNWHKSLATLQPAGNEYFGSRLAFGNGVFVGLAGSNILSSIDGSNWTQRARSGHAVCNVTVGDGRFLVVGQPFEESDRTYRMPFHSSNDGTNWTSTLSPVHTPAVYVEGMACGNGYVCVPWGAWYSSAHGVWGWTNGPGLLNAPYASRVLPTSQKSAAVGFGNGRFVGIGYGLIMESADGSAWSAFPHSYSFSSGDIFYEVVPTEGGFVFVGRSSPSRGLLLAPWATAGAYPNYVPQLCSGAFGKRRMIVVGDGGTILLSSPYATTLPSAPVIHSADAVSGAVGSSFSYQAVASGQPTLFGALGLPQGLALNPTTGLISGVPTEFGTFAVTLSAANEGGIGSVTLPVTISAYEPAPVISSSLSASGQLGQAFSYPIAANHNPTSFAAAGLPDGLTNNPATGEIAGTPTVSGVFPVQLAARNSTGYGTATLRLTIDPGWPQPPVITSPGTALGVVGSPFSYQITAANAPQFFGASGLPGGLTLDPGNGLISGTPTAWGTFPILLSAANAGGVGTALLNLSIPAPLLSTPVITSALTATATPGIPFQYQITASGNPTRFAAGGLPAWLGINTQSGLLSGTPTSNGVFEITLSAANSAGAGSAALTMTVSASTPLRFDPNCVAASNGIFRLRSVGPDAAAVIWDISADLRNWMPWQTNTLSNGVWDILVPIGTNRQQFFRLRSP